MAKRRQISVGSAWPQLRMLQFESSGNALTCRRTHVLDAWWNGHCARKSECAEEPVSRGTTCDVPMTHSHLIGGVAVHTMTPRQYDLCNAAEAVQWLDRFATNGMGRALSECGPALTLSPHQVGYLLDTSVSRLTDCRISLHPHDCSKLMPCAMPETIAKMIGNIATEICEHNASHTAVSCCSVCNWRPFPGQSPVHPRYNATVVFHLRGCLDKSYPQFSNPDQLPPILDHIDWIAPKTMSHVLAHEIFSKDADTLQPSVKDSPLFTEWGRVRSLAVFVLDSTNADPRQTHTVFVSSLTATDMENTEISDAGTMGSAATHVSPVFNPRSSVLQRGSVLEQLHPDGSPQSLHTRQIEAGTMVAVKLPVDGSRLLHIPPELFDKVVIGMAPTTLHSHGCYLVFALHIPVSLLPEYTPSYRNGSSIAVPGRVPHELLHTGIQRWRKTRYPGLDALQTWSADNSYNVMSTSDTVCPHLAPRSVSTQNGSSPRSRQPTRRQ